MCLSRFIDGVTETEEYGKDALTGSAIAQRQLREKDGPMLNKRSGHLRGVVPFEVLRKRRDLDE